MAKNSYGHPITDNLHKATSEQRTRFFEQLADFIAAINEFQVLDISAGEER